MSDQLTRAATAWRRANKTARATVAGALVLVLVGGVILAVNEDAQRALSDATGLSVATANVQVSSATGEPAVVVDTNHLGRFQYYVRGQDNKLWQRRWNGQSWLWESFVSGPTLASAPSIGRGGDSEMLFVRGSDGRLWYTARPALTQGAWGPWQNLGGQLTSGPSAVGSNGDLYVFVRWADSGFWFRRYAYASGSWGDWGAVGAGGLFTSGPGAASAVNAQAFVLGKGNDDAIYYRITQDQHWSSASWLSLGGVLTSAPAAAEWQNNLGWSLVVAARGADNAIWIRSKLFYFDDLGNMQEGGWDGWESLGGIFTSGPTLIGLARVEPGTDNRFNQVRVVARGTDGKLWYKDDHVSRINGVWSRPAWTTWAPIE